MILPAGRRLERLFRGVLAARVPILLFYALLVPFAVAFALKVPHDAAIDRLVVSGDEDHAATHAFQEAFPEGDRILLLVEARDPFSAEVVRRVVELENRLRPIPGVSAVSAPSIFERLRPGRDVEEFRRFAAGTELLRRQGLVGPDFLAVAVELRVEGAAARDATLEAIDAAAAGIPFRRIGAPYVESYLERETARATARYMPLFGAFVVLLVLGLYRSWRALAAVLLTLAAAVALGVGIAWPLGFAFSIVSSLVPLTVLITATATLVYLHSRYVEQPDGTALEDHHARALANKFLPCTASVLAAVAGFAALAVSEIRPVYEMGVWTAAGLAVAWVVCFTLFPALQRVLRTPTHQERLTAGRFWPALVEWIIPFSFRFRWPLVIGSTAVMVAGGVALSGMRLETDALDYLDRDLPLRVDTLRFERAAGGLTVVEAWVRTPDGSVLDPEVLRGLSRFASGLEAEPSVAAVAGPTTLLRWMRYAGGGGDRLPDDPAAWPRLASDLEQLLLTEPAARGFVDVGSLGQARVTVRARAEGWEGLEALREAIERCWAQAARDVPALASASVRVVGDGVLQAKISRFLVPTLVESFVLTAAIIFVAFLAVFRSGPARLLAMIPSIFAILAMFLVMRGASIPLNVATILIASTVLGASENDQIHFFYHFQERRKNGTCAQALRHALLVAGRPVAFATLINAGGFLALALSDLPPMRQFGVMSASAFALGMLADFTALPAALWIVFRERPDAGLQMKDS
ncbi:MAG TPA: MMPL family transporter [Candidatus Polarisedimenticolaceae bacterium]